MEINQNERTALKKLITNRKDTSSFCQSPIAWLHKNNIHALDEYKNDYDQLKFELAKINFGPQKCKNCENVVTRLMPGIKKGFMLTCSNACKNERSSIRMSGEKNPRKTLSPERWVTIHKKQSITMKQKILDGTFTPKSENYRTHKMLEYYHIDGSIRKVRSLWELIFWLETPELEYETVRIKYYDTSIHKNRIYIVDFFDPKTNTLYEIKPKKYLYTLQDKQPAAINAGYNYKIIDEDHFNKSKTPTMISLIEERAVNLEEVRNRLKWLKNA